MFFILRTARLHRREWTVAIELLAMVDYVTDTLKTSRLKKVDMIDMTVANATSTMLPTGWQPSCSTVDRLVGAMRNMLRVAKRAAEQARARDTRVLVSRMRQLRCATRACWSCTRRRPRWTTRRPRATVRK